MRLYTKNLAAVADIEGEGAMPPPSP